MYVCLFVGGAPFLFVLSRGPLADLCLAKIHLPRVVCSHGQIDEPRFVPVAVAGIALKLISTCTPSIPATAVFLSSAFV